MNCFRFAKEIVFESNINHRMDYFGGIATSVRFFFIGGNSPHHS